MRRYIDADAINLKLPFLNSDSELLVSINDVKRAIEQTPTADVVEVRHGEWQDTGDKELDTIYSGYRCSVCGFVICGHSGKYCSECGAKMDGKRSDDK